LGRAEATIRAVLARQPRDAEARLFLSHVYLNRAEVLSLLSRFPEAVAAWDGAIEFDDGGQLDALKAARAVTFVRSGDYRRALAEADALAGPWSIPPGQLAYNLACIEALASAAARADTTLEPAARGARAEDLAARAIARLGQARAAGFFRDPAEVAHMGQDADLEPLRSRGDFRLLMQDLAFPADPFAR
jgi:hypothetical protein